MAQALRVSSLQAENATEFYRGVSEYLGQKLEGGTVYIGEVPWEERARLLDRGEIDACFVCGWNYTARRDSGSDHLELCATPVFAAPRYRGLPIYFSDVVVRADSSARRFADLRGCRWAYNEPRSHSGYNLTLYHLAALGESGHYFGESIHAGAHQRAIDMVLGGEADAAAVDSYVLECEQRDRPWLAESLRVIETLGPSPAPPFVLHKRLLPAVRREVREVLCSMHDDPRGAAILGVGLATRFAAVADADYQPIREMEQKTVGLSL